MHTYQVTYTDGDTLEFQGINEMDVRWQAERYRPQPIRSITYLR